MGARLLAGFLQGLLYGVTPGDPLSFVAVPCVLSLAALVACYLPAKRASGVDPAVVLRGE